MKLQCSCGAKYAFDATPEMLQHPVKFICPSCGLDSSEFVNRAHPAGIWRAKPAAARAGTPAAPPPPAAARLANRAMTPPPPRRRRRPRRPPSSAPNIASGPRRNAPSARNRFVPSAWNCSAFSVRRCARAKPRRSTLDVPVYAGRKDVVEARFWRKTGLIAGVARAGGPFVSGRVDLVCVGLVPCRILVFRCGLKTRIAVTTGARNWWARTRLCFCMAARWRVTT